MVAESSCNSKSVDILFCRCHSKERNSFPTALTKLLATKTAIIPCMLQDISYDDYMLNIVRSHAVCQTEDDANNVPNVVPSLNACMQSKVCT